MFALVRHGHAGDKAAWTGDDELRPLSERGRQQAQGLVLNLEALAASRLIASPSLRCRQTLAPLAAVVGRPVETSDLLAPDPDIPALDRYLRDPGHERAVFCTHGETLNALLAHWHSTGRFDISTNGSKRAHTSTEKGAAWIVVADGDHLHAEYVRPLHVGPVLHETS